MVAGDNIIRGGNLTINDGEIITEGISIYNIDNVNFTMNGGEIYSKDVSIYNVSPNNRVENFIKINGGNIGPGAYGSTNVGNNYAIYNTNTKAQIIIGDSSKEISTTSPKIENRNTSKPTIYTESEQFYFNNGRIENKSANMYNKTPITRPGYKIKQTTETYQSGDDEGRTKYIEYLEEGSASWYYKEDSEGRKTIVTNGKLELKIGDYINYNAAATDANETKTEVKTVTSYAGSPTISGYYKASSQKITEGNGYKDQTFSNEADTNGWRVLGVDEEKGELLIISADPVKTTANDNFYIQGAAGYQYGESELDKVCGVFGSGYGATGARSIDVDDVNKITGYNPNNVGVYDPEQKGSGTKYGQGLMHEYGNKITFSWNRKYSGNLIATGTNGLTGQGGNHGLYGFNWFDLTKNEWKNNSTLTGDITTLTSNGYGYYPHSLSLSTTGEKKGISTTSAEYLTLFCNSSGKEVYYALATRSIRPYVFTTRGVATDVPDGENFCIGVVSNGKVNINLLYHSNGQTYAFNTGIRPVVSLKSDIQLQYDISNSYYDIVEWSDVTIQ